MDVAQKAGGHEMHSVPDEKDLVAEANILEHVTYIKMAGASHVENFRSPDAYVFIFFEKSEGWHSIDFERYEEGDCQVHISFPEQIHSWNSGSGTRGHKLIVSKYFVEKYMFETAFINAKFNYCPVLNLDAGFFKKITREVVLLSEELNVAGIRADLAMVRTKLILTLINLYITEHVKKDLVEKKANPILNRFSVLLHEGFGEGNTVSYYADKLAITPNYLNIICRRYAGVNAKHFISQRRLLEAKRLLLGSELSIKEIAFKLGFNEISNFSFYIKSNTGFYPRQYREQPV
ncbi:helix-turn-helix domain-containing protein [Niabella pedocola]|uniref:Helix-turn-helix domain-containing protein n=1 Tax=Niabella pedocola TaxID=1752077 RepID=A0ABS8PQ29_9BACT|nr:helix-turn-helix domain-containing protein [Niabella pedocola]MCD2422417.1 helix-turn-helix domain-containing protein [Niabella pedocola]